MSKVRVVDRTPVDASVTAPQVIAYVRRLLSTWHEVPIRRDSDGLIGLCFIGRADEVTVPVGSGLI